MKACEKCSGYHGRWPLQHLKEGEDCGFDPEAPCSVCGQPVRRLSFGGPAVCPACDCGRHRDTGKKWTFEEALLIGRDRITPQQARETMRPIVVGVVTGKPHEVVAAWEEKAREHPGDYVRALRAIWSPRQGSKP